VDETGHPRLGDFGLSRMMEKDQSLWQTSATQAPGTTRWKAVELMTGDQATVSVPADVWAYAMTSYVRFFCSYLLTSPVLTNDAGTDDRLRSLLAHHKRNRRHYRCRSQAEAASL
jgi:serine/threonine protein kinase